MLENLKVSAATAGLCAAFLLIVMLTTGWPRDFGQYAQSDPARREWFNRLGRPDMKPAFYGCCSEADCKEVESRLSPTGGYQVKVDDVWYDFPKEKVETDEKILRSNPTGTSVVCYIKYPDGNINWYCLEPWDVLG